jgi:hypothetical protein
MVVGTGQGLRLLKLPYKEPDDKGLIEKEIKKLSPALNIVWNHLRVQAS